MKIAFAILALFSFTLLQAQTETDKRLPPMGGKWGIREAEVKDANLPSVLCVGDSILNGYLPSLRQSLDGKANVDAWVTPVCQASGELNPTLAGILSEKKYAAIHINLGLHGWQKGRIPEGQFEPLTQKMLDTLRKGAPNATIIWASTTPVTVKGKPGELFPEINDVVVEHNRLAASVMTANKIPINDLYTLMSSHLDLSSGDMFHWKPEGAKLQGEHVAQIILKFISVQK
ncbi:SGNH/GDSL hydrolase family protein [soil metagenome]